MFSTSDQSAAVHVSIFAEFLDRYSRIILSATLVVTLLLVLPLVLLDAPPQASQNPTGPVFDFQNEIDKRFESPIHVFSLVVEARDGDILGQ